MMKKLTAEVARMELANLKALSSHPSHGISIKAELFMQSLEIALPILEQQENQGEKCNGTGQMDSGGTQPWGDAIMVSCDCQPPTDTYRQIENNDWIEWKGGPCEVSNHADVEVRYLAGYKARGKADVFDWHIRILPKSIIAYRVIENDGRDG